MRGWIFRMMFYHKISLVVYVIKEGYQISAIPKWMIGNAYHDIFFSQLDPLGESVLLGPLNPFTNKMYDVKICTDIHWYVAILSVYHW